MFAVAMVEIIMYYAQSIVIKRYGMSREGSGMEGRQGIALGVVALVLYIVGGVATFGGIALAAFMKGRDLLGWGDGRSIGWLFLCSGICLSILGVLLMRIFRNRGVR